MDWIDWGQVAILGDMLLAMLLGAVIGWEREAADKPAGFRTHMLVAGAAAMLVAIGEIIVEGQLLNADMIRSDPVRIVEAVITGVSFLGAGTIIRGGSQGQVAGLTTGASLLFVAAVGISVGLDKLLLAIGATVLVLVVLLLGRFYESRRGQQMPESHAE